MLEGINNSLRAPGTGLQLLPKYSYNTTNSIKTCKITRLEEKIVNITTSYYQQPLIPSRMTPFLTRVKSKMVYLSYSIVKSPSELLPFYASRDNRLFLFSEHMVFFHHRFQSNISFDIFKLLLQLCLIIVNGHMMQNMKKFKEIS